jgi:hypothetical protein
MQAARQRDTLQTLVGPIGSVARCKLRLNLKPKVNVCRLGGSVRPCKVRLNPQPTVNVCGLLRSVTPCERWLNLKPKGQCLQAARQRDTAQALVEPV